MIRYEITSYGAEHELADWSLDRGLPEGGFAQDRDDITIVNSNGIAADPKGKYYRYGGEINTPPTDISGQVECLKAITKMHPEAQVNYRSNLHLHVCVPGLKENLALLKKMQLYIHTYMPIVLPIIEPIPEPFPFVTDYPSKVAYKGAMKRYRRRKVSHQTLLKPERVQYQLAASTIDEFFKREVPVTKKTGKPMWYAQPRLCVNLRQLLETNTIEFRHFPGTLDLKELETCLRFVDSFTRLALEQVPLDEEWVRNMFPTEGFPKFKPYKHDLEVNYLATVRGKNKPAEIKANIKSILEKGHV